MATIKFENGQTVNFEGTPTQKDVEEVAMKLGITPQRTAPAPSKTLAPDPHSGTLGTNPNDSIYGKILDNSITRGIQDIMPGEKVGQAIGTLGGLGVTAVKEKLGMVPEGSTSMYDTSAPSPKQVIGDAAMMLLTPQSLGGKTLGTGGKIATDLLNSAKANPTVSNLVGKSLQSGIQGAYFGAAQGMKDDKSFTDIVRNTGGNAVVSSLFPTANIAVTKAVGGLVDTLPRSMTRSFLNQTKRELMKGKDMSDKFLEGGRIGTVSSLLDNSKKMVTNLNTSIGEALNAPGYKTKMIDRNTWLDSLVKNINDKGGAITRKELLADIQSDVPGGAGLLKQNKLTLPELDKLRRRIGDSLSDSAWLANKSTFSKQNLKNIYGTLSEEVKKNAPTEVRGMFEDLSKEHSIHDALAGRAAEKAHISLKEIIGALGLGLVNPVAGIVGFGGIKAAESAPARTLTAQALYQGGKKLKEIAPAVRNVAATTARTLSSQ